MGGYYFDFKVKRLEATHYGLTVGDVERIIETAVGGKNIGYTIEGRERYPINVRYPRELRSDIEALSRVLVPTPTGAQVPISLLAEISYSQGPPMIRDEDGQLVGYVFVDVTHQDYEGYVNQAQQAVREREAAPMVGGLVTSFVLELTVYPAIFLLWKGTEIGGWRSLIPGAPLPGPDGLANSPGPIPGRPQARTNR